MYEPLTMDFPVFNGNLHNADKRPQFQIIPNSLLYIMTSVYWKPLYSEWLTPNYGHQNHAPMGKISLWKQTILIYWCKRAEKILLFLKILTVSILSSMFEGLSALKECLCMLSFWTCGLFQLERVITLPSALSVPPYWEHFKLAWSRGVCNTVVPLYVHAWWSRIKVPYSNPPIFFKGSLEFNRPI